MPPTPKKARNIQFLVLKWQKILVFGTKMEKKSIYGNKDDIPLWQKDLNYPLGIKLPQKTHKLHKNTTLTEILHKPRFP